MAQNGEEHEAGSEMRDLASIAASVGQEDSFKLLHTLTESGINCVDWSKDDSNPLLIAAGITKGSLSLYHLLADSPVVKRFRPRVSRRCNDVSWNPQFPNKIAVGLDRVNRGMDGCVFVWDVNQKDEDRGMGSMKFGVDVSGAVTSPLSSLSPGESTVSLSWLPDNGFALATGSSQRLLRIYDIRLSNPTISVVAHLRSVKGVRFDPHRSNYLLTFSDDPMVKLWDLRKLRQKSPIMEVDTSKALASSKVAPKINDISWCPTHKDIISVSYEGLNSVSFWDFGGNLGFIARAKSRVHARVQAPYRCLSFDSPVSCLAWHPSKLHHLIYSSKQSNLRSMVFRYFSPLSWSATGAMSFGFNSTLEIGQELEDDGRLGRTEDADISELMKERAQLGYGVDVDDNLSICVQTDASKWHQYGHPLQPSSHSFVYSSCQTA